MQVGAIFHVFNGSEYVPSSHNGATRKVELPVSSQSKTRQPLHPVLLSNDLKPCSFVDDIECVLDSQSSVPVRDSAHDSPKPYLPSFIFLYREAVMYVEFLGAVRWVAELIKMFIDQIPA